MIAALHCWSSMLTDDNTECCFCACERACGLRHLRELHSTLLEHLRTAAPYVAFVRVGELVTLCV
eukprot:4020352-Amphidinium_carterae.1